MSAVYCDRRRCLNEVYLVEFHLLLDLCLDPCDLASADSYIGNEEDPSVDVAGRQDGVDVASPSVLACSELSHAESHLTLLES